MNRTTFSLEVFGDGIALPREGADNRKYIEHLKKMLRSAVANDLTPAQRKAVTEFYFNGKSVGVISEELGVNKSTVSRNLKRARARLSAVMKYGLAPVFLDEQTI